MHGIAEGCIPLLQMGVADWNDEICFGRRAERASQNKFHSSNQQPRVIKSVTAFPRFVEYKKWGAGAVPPPPVSCVREIGWIKAGGLQVGDGHIV